MKTTGKITAEIQKIATTYGMNDLAVSAITLAEYIRHASDRTDQSVMDQVWKHVESWKQSQGGH